MGCTAISSMPNSNGYEKRKIMDKKTKRDTIISIVVLVFVLLFTLTLLILQLLSRKLSPQQLTETVPTEQVTEMLPTEPETTIPEETEPTQPSIYPHAVVDYLGEDGDYTQFSNERIYPPEFVMIHFCSAIMTQRKDPYNMDYVRQNFINDDVSVHYILDREGNVHCYIPEDRVAWHTGKGTWKDNEKYENAMNQYAIGIELVGIGSQEDMSIYLSKAQYNAIDDSLKGFTDAQYASLQELVAYLCQKYDIPMDRDHIIGHDEYASRKNDPGQLFDWSQIISEEK